MENFIWFNPTKLYFGKNQITQLYDELKKYRKVLFVYGSGSIKKTGLYDEITEILRSADISYCELPGVEPNPKLSLVRKGIKTVKENDIDLILAAGGGSTIDTAKAISVGAVSKHDILDLLLNRYVQEEGLAVGTVLTLSATGSEMNPRVVISDDEQLLKLGLGAWDVPATYPRFSICDPTYTLSVPKNQTRNGIIDMISHTFEQYFNRNENSVMGDKLAEAIIKTMIDIGPNLLNDLDNYRLRETMMICGTMAWNGILRGLCNHGDWACHQMEHALSAVYDIPHAEGLAIIMPIWMEYCAKLNPDKFVKMAVNIFGINPENKTPETLAAEGIREFRSFLQKLGAPLSMDYYKILTYDLNSLAEKSLLGKDTIGQYISLNKEAIKEILGKAF